MKGFAVHVVKVDATAVEDLYTAEVIAGEQFVCNECGANGYTGSGTRIFCSNPSCPQSEQQLGRLTAQ